MINVLKREICRACGGPLDPVLNLGDLRISTFPDLEVDLATLPHAPLHLMTCTKCALVQLAHTVDPQHLFADHYWYRSGINETMVAELRDVVQQAAGLVPITRGSLVLDIGANDGTLLQQYLTMDRRPYRIAVEPSATFRGDLADQHLDDLRPTFFPDADLIAEFRGKVKVITSIACFYDVDDPHAFVAGIAQLLAPDGVWVVQFQDLAQMLAATAVDNLCHEHLTYYSLGDVERIAQAHDLVVVHAEPRPINGGSLRLLLQHRKTAYVRTSVDDQRKREDGCQHWETLSSFSWRATTVAKQVRACVAACPGQLDLYGASTKGNTLLQLAQLGEGEIRQAWERSPAKWGRQTVTGIPIVSEEDGRADPPAGLLCGIWQFRAAVLAREREVLAGRFMIFPLPEVDVVHVIKSLEEA